MPGLLTLSLLLFGLASDAPAERGEPLSIADLTPFVFEPPIERIAEPPNASRPRIDLDAEVLLYTGMPVEIRGQTMFAYGLSYYASLSSFAFDDQNRLIAIIGFSSKLLSENSVFANPPEGFAVVRVEANGTVEVLAVSGDPVGGDPEIVVKFFGGLSYGESFTDFAVLACGSIRMVASLESTPTRPLTNGRWIVDINQGSVTPVARIDGHLLPQGGVVDSWFDVHSDFAYPLGGIGQWVNEGLIRKVVWEINEKHFENALTFGPHPLFPAVPAGSPRHARRLADGSVLVYLSDGGFPDESARYTRILDGKVQTEFWASGGDAPALPDGSERLAPAHSWSSGSILRFDSGYAIQLRNLLSSPQGRVLARDLGQGIERLTDSDALLELGAGPMISDVSISVSPLGHTVVKTNANSAQNDLMLWSNLNGSQQLIAGSGDASRLGVLGGMVRSGRTIRMDQGGAMIFYVSENPGFFTEGALVT